MAKPKTKLKKGAEMVVEVLLSEGVDIAWGVTGGAILPVYDALYMNRDKIRLIDTRHEQGSTNSIAVGKTLKCLSCGSRDIGGNGQLWMMFISNGLLGAFLYCAFFLFGICRYWRDPTPYGLAGVLVLLLQFPFMLVYVAVGPPLVWTMLAYALLWKNDRVLKQERAEAAAARLTGPGAPGSQLAVAT